jgi:hypothetical protein
MARSRIKKARDDLDKLAEKPGGRSSTRNVAAC